MAHNNHIIDGINKDFTNEKNRDYYLNLTKDFKSQLPDLIIEKVEGINVVREDISLKGGTKSRAGEFLMSSIKKNTVVYCVPRVGHAAIAIMELAKMYGKEVVFFMPSSKEVSDHQAAVIDMKPKEVHFERIAAMPNLNRIAKKYAEDNDYEFLPFGLNHTYVIAGFVHIAEQILKNYKEPEEMWTAISTGVLTRGLQIGFPNCDMHGVCVARNMKAGELGRTKVISEPLDFYTHEKNENRPPFNSVSTYDSKVWKYVPKNSDKDVWFWNVAGEIYKPIMFDVSKVNSYRDWAKNIINK